jgi:hypothetical protein
MSDNAGKFLRSFDRGEVRLSGHDRTVDHVRDAFRKLVAEGRAPAESTERLVELFVQARRG